MKQYISPFTDVIEISTETIIMNMSGEGISWETSRYDGDKYNLEDPFFF